MLAASLAHARPDPHDSVAVALRAGRYQAAYRLLQATADTADIATHRIRRAMCLLNLGQPQAADSLFASAPADGFQVPYRDYWQAIAWYRAGDQARAAKGFDRLSASPAPPVRDSSQVWALRCGLENGDSALTARALARLVGRSDDLAAVGWFARMRCASAAGDSAQWASAWLTLLERFPGTPEAYQAALLADSLGWRGKGTQLVALAQMYAGQGNPDLAARAWYQAIEDTELILRRPEMRARLAELLIGGRRYREAEGQITALLGDSTARNWWPATLRLYANLERKRNAETQSRHWEMQFVERFPEHEQVPDALWNVAMSWERVGNCAEAVKVYEQLAERYPSHPLAEAGRWRTGFCAYLAGRYSEAHRQFSRLARTTEDFALADQASYWSGLALHSADQLEEARLEWDRAAAYSPRSYYAVASAISAGRPIVPPEDERPLPRVVARPDTAWPGFIEARWLSSVGEWRWARSVLAQGTSGLATSVEDMEALADAFEAIADYSVSLRWRWRAMWRRTTEDRYHELPPDLLRRIWPDFFREEVTAAARENGIDPALVWAIIRQESIFDPDVTSQADARGLMQIVPSTGAALARQVGINEFTPTDLYDPCLNIRLGTKYVAQLLDRFKKIDLVAAAYNAGPSNAVRWQQTSGSNHDVLRETITYSETRRYVKLVLKNYLIYRSLYRERRERQP